MVSKLKVKLIAHTPNPDKTVATSARICYAKIGIDELSGQMTDEKVKDMIKKAVGSGHFSVTEHASFTFAIEGVSRACTHQLVRHRIASYCLTGDTVIKGARQKSKNYKKFTLKSLYERMLTSHGRSRIKLIMLNSYDEDKNQFDRGKIKDIVHTGKHEVWEVKTSDGKSIKATLNHRFLTKDGWCTLKEIIQNKPELAVNGTTCRSQNFSLLRDRDWLNDYYNVRNYRQDEIAKLIGCSEHTVRAWIRRHGIQKETGGLHGHPPHTGYHWKLGRERTEAESCHRKVNAHESEYCDMFGTESIPYYSHSSGCYRTVKWAKIECIEPKGIEDTYDITMEGPHHNFVANGFVVHNSQQSQRYVDAENFDYIIPPKIAADEKARKKFEDFMQQTKEFYRGLREIAPKEDARYILPNATDTKIIVTMNTRSLYNFFEKRCCMRAQWEIRELAEMMLKECKKVSPLLFENAGPTCTSQKVCREGEHSCGKWKSISGAVLMGQEK